MTIATQVQGAFNARHNNSVDTFQAIADAAGGEGWNGTAYVFGDDSKAKWSAGVVTTQAKRAHVDAPKAPRCSSGVRVTNQDVADAVIASGRPATDNRIEDAYIEIREVRGNPIRFPETSRVVRRAISDERIEDIRRRVEVGR